MPLLGFKKQFAPLIDEGRKRQTIRAKRKDGNDPKPGDMLHLYTGLRTKSCRKIGDAVCKSVEEIKIDWDFWKVPGCCEIATNDGFDCVNDMIGFFEDAHGLPFSGLLIKW